MPLSNIYGQTRVLLNSDYHHLGRRLITPFDPDNVQPASYDVTLGDRILVPRDKPVELRAGSGIVHEPYERVDLRTTKPAELMIEHRIGTEGIVLPPHTVALVSTFESISCPSDMVCSVDGKSTLGRCFVAIHVTAGFIDPGYCGNVTLELVNHGPWEFMLYPGMKIGQLRFTWLGKEVDRPYGSPGLGSHYQGTVGVRGAEALHADVVPAEPLPRFGQKGWCEGCE